MAISKDRGDFSAWTAVAMGGVSEGAEIDVSTHYLTRLFLQGFLDTGAATAHTGTQFLVQLNPELTGDEGWATHLWWSELVGTCNPEPSTLNPAAIGTTVFTVASTTGYVVNDVPMPYIVIQDATLANSEILLLKSIVANTSLTVVDGSTRQHANTSVFGNIAFSKDITVITKDVTRMRVLVNNNFDSNGAVINWRFAWTANLK